MGTREDVGCRVTGAGYQVTGVGLWMSDVGYEVLGGFASATFAFGTLTSGDLFMRYILPWLLLLSPVLGFAQNSSSDMPKSSNVIRWQEGASNSDSLMSDGQEVKVISSDSVTVSVTLIERKNWIPHALVIVENKKTDRFLVDPRNWTLNVVGAKPMVLRSREPEALARSLENRGKWAAAIGTATASMATTQSTATIRNSDGTTSTATITGPDRATRTLGSSVFADT